MNILSVDWDYFFPDLSEYDWGANEDINYYYEMIWPVRYHDIGIISKERACDNVNPSGHKDFWQKILTNSDIKRIVITDSHKDIEILLCNGYNSIWNFDQHHDMDDRVFNLTCANWVTALKVPLKKYHLVYPWWRASTLIKDIPQLYFGPGPKVLEKIRPLPNPPPNFDTIFLCRSSCWTPPWSDNEWIKFIDQLSSMFPTQWRNKISLEYVMKPRKFNINSAKQYKELYETELKH